MKKTVFSLLTIVSMLAFTGCNNNSSSSRAPVIVEPEPPVVPPYIPPVDPDPEHPTVGTGSVNYTPSCETGFAKVKYVYEADSTIDSNSFVIIHSVNGVQHDIHTAAGNHNGSVMIMEDHVLIAENDTTEPIAHQIEIEFITDGHSQVNSFAFIQPECSVVEPDPDPDPDPKPDPKPVVEPYEAHTDYIIGDVITIVDDTGVTRKYECITAYRSGKKGNWDTFEKESDNWSRIHHGDTSLNIVTTIR